MIPPGWKTYQLKDLVEINKTSLGKKHNYDWIEYIDTSSVVENRFDCFKILKANEAPSRAKRIVKVNDIIYSTVRPIQRHYGFIRQAKENTIASTGFAVITPTKIEPKFLYYYLARDEIVNYLNGVAETNTTTYPAFNASLLNHLVVTIPDNFNEQYRISTILSSLDDKIELNLEMNKTLESIAQAIFKEWFVGEKNTYLSQYVDFNPKVCIPKGMLTKYVEMSDLPVSGFSIMTEVGRNYSSGSKFENNDILLARITPCLENGKTGFVDFLETNEYGCGSTEFIVMRAKERISPYYVYLVARDNNFREFAIKSMVGTSGRQRVQTDLLRSFLIPAIDIAKMDEFNNIVSPLFNRIKLNSDAIFTLSSIRDLLIPKLMTGKIRVA
jgi:type I restriction enzyme S subunit